MKHIIKLVKVINKEFRPPFVKKDLVKAKYTDSGFNLRIGGRDVSLDKDFNVTGAGTILDCEEA